MKVQTTYTPTDSSGEPFNLSNLYSLADLEQLASDLVKAGIGPNDALWFRVELNGALTVSTERVL